MTTSRGGSVWSSTAGPISDCARVYAETVSFRPADRVFVDESKARGYYVVATASATGWVQASEKALRGLLKPGQRRIHFKSESDRRRREILARLCELDVRVSVWLVRGVADREARPLCLAALTDKALRDRVAHLVIERDASLERADRQLIAAALRAHPAAEFRYEHAAPHDRPLLWVSDAVAWCYSNGGDWVRRVEAIVQGRVTRL